MNDRLTSLLGARAFAFALALATTLTLLASLDGLAVQQHAGTELAAARAAAAASTAATTATPALRS